MTALLTAATVTGLLLLGFGVIGWWAHRDDVRKKAARIARQDSCGYQVAEQGYVAAAICDAILAGRHPLAVKVHSHPSGRPVVDVICDGDAVARAEELLGETA